MPDFKKGGLKKKGKGKQSSLEVKKKFKPVRKTLDEEIVSSESENEDDSSKLQNEFREDESMDVNAEEHITGKGKKRPLSDDEDSDTETVDEKRLRLAKEFLGNLAQEADIDADDDNAVTFFEKELEKDVLMAKGKLQMTVADKIVAPVADDIRMLRGHKGSITCAVISADNKYIYSAGKDSLIAKWCVESGTKVKSVAGGRKGTEDSHIGHTTKILSMALSTDSKFLVTGDELNSIYVWDPDTMKRLKVLKRHRKPVTALAFRKDSHNVFSGSEDRQIILWDLDQMNYIDNMVGHDCAVTGIDSLASERCVSVAGAHQDVLMWKPADDKQTVFKGHKSQFECVAMINEETFVTGSSDNCLCLWTTSRKKANAKIQKAHAQDSPIANDMWITAVAALPYTDLIASGARDGFIRLWKCTPEFKSAQLLHEIPVAGVVNSLKFSSDGSMLIAGIGQEARMGRWWNIKTAKNGTLIVRLNQSS